MTFLRFSAVRFPLLTLALMAAALHGEVARGQTSPGHRLPASTISGSVVDAETGGPLASASVVLELEHAGVIPANAAGGSAFLSASRHTLTASDGRYRFSDLPSGRYRLRVDRTGYRPNSVAVDFNAAGRSRIAIGLTVQAIPLQPIEVTGVAAPLYGHSGRSVAETDSARLAALRLRRMTSLSTDAREITHADVVEAVTLGETDLLRALQRLPGVTTRDDYSAELWLRGAPWDQTRVYFDGLPLFNPVHGVGALSGVSTHAIGAAWLHPGVRSPQLGEGAAGVLELRSRRGSGDGELNGQAEISLLSSSLGLDRTFQDGRGDWMISARRSYVDLVTNAIGAMADDPGIHLPYAFSDIAGRVDYQVDGDRSIEASWLWERDGFSGDLPDILHGNAAGWGNAVGRVTWEAPLRGLRARHTFGVSRYGARVREVETNPDLPYSAGTEPPSRSSLLYAVVGGQFEPAAAGVAPLWSGGYQLVLQASEYDGPLPGLRGFGRREPGRLSSDGTLGMLAVWGERTWRPAERLSLEAGLRLETGPAVAGGGRIRPAPRIAARYQITPGVALSAGAARVFQYSQAAAATGPHLYFPTDRLWILAGEEHPVLRSDIATMGAEAWLGGGWLAAANGYLRRARGVAVRDPVPGRLDDQRVFVFGENAAEGVELSLRRLTGRWTGSLGYTLSESRMKAEGRRFPADEDRRHAVNATGMLRAGESLRLGAAYTAMTGAPFTRIRTREGGCGTTGCARWVEVGAPNAGRTPAYASLDLLLDWMHSFDGWKLGAYLQLRNVLGHDNSILYASSDEGCLAGWSAEDGCAGGLVTIDRYDRGIPTIPLIGLRVRF